MVDLSVNLDTLRIDTRCVVFYPIRNEHEIAALADISSNGDNQVIVNRLRALVQALRRVPAVQIEKSKPNVAGTTREPLKVATNVASINGRQAVVVEGQSFSAGTTVFNVDTQVGKHILKASKNDVAKAQ